MSVVDAPPGLDFGGPAIGEFRGRRRPRTLARVTFGLCLLDGAITFSLASKSLHQPGTSTLFVAPVMCLAIALVGLAVRNARVIVDEGGLYWGWKNLGGRVPKVQIDKVLVYEKGLTMSSTKNTVWYLAQYDWEEFDSMPHAFVKAGVSVENRPGNAPWRARIKAYGVFLDGLMVFTLMMSAALVLFAVLR